MVNRFGGPPPSGGIDRSTIRIAVLGVLILVIFVALFSRLWFLQVLAADNYRQLAKENRVRRVQTEPPRGRVFDSNGKLLVDNRRSLAITVDRQRIDERDEQNALLRKLTTLIVDRECLPSKKEREPRPEKLKRERTQTFRAMKEHLADITVSPFKPVAVAYDVPLEAVMCIRDNRENFPGVADEQLSLREYPQGATAAQIVGYVGEITKDELKSDYFKNAQPRYAPGDIVGHMGLERYYDRILRGRPGISKVVVDSSGDPIGPSQTIQEQSTGKDLSLSVDTRVQRLTEQALANGAQAAAGFNQPPEGGAVVMDPSTGGIIAMASYPTYDPAILADGYSFKDANLLGAKTPNEGGDDALFNRVTQSEVPPGSTFKVVTAAAGIVNHLLAPTEQIDCNPYFEYLGEQFNNYTTADLGFVELARSLEISCDTYYYIVGARLEDQFGVARGDGSERFQKYMRRVSFGHPTGLDLPFETSGRVPDEAWYEDFCPLVNTRDFCDQGWLPGYTVNMAIGQGDLTVSPLQMAVMYAAIANGGDVLQPHLAARITQPNPETGESEVVREIEPRAVNTLGLDEASLATMREGLIQVVSGGGGTATGAFAGFPLDQYQVAGKTGTAQIGSVESGNNYAWFTSYAPADDPQYVVVVYVRGPGHGGDTAAPIAREIYEGIFELDQETDVQIGSGDTSG
jgi:penicillin-binding protein 2